MTESAVIYDNEINTSIDVIFINEPYDVGNLNVKCSKYLLIFTEVINIF